MEPDGTADPDRLRALIAAQQRELDALRRESDHGELLIDALNAMLVVHRDDDPFAGVFAVLESMFGASHALILGEPQDPAAPGLECIAATVPELVGGCWPRLALFEQALGGEAGTAPDGLGAEGWPGRAAAAGLSAAQSALCVPVGFRERRGVVVLLRAAGAEPFAAREAGLVAKLSLLASHAFAARMANRGERERERLRAMTDDLRTAQASLAHRANHDPLTGLPNRGFFEEQVRFALAGAGPDRRLALAFIDLDGFKQVNDLYGHAAGDGLLVGVAERMRGRIRGSDVLARISGDEFALMLDPVDSPQMLEAIVGRVAKALKAPIEIGSINVLPSASIGVAIFPDHGSRFEELMGNADRAMYAGKSSARGRATFFDGEIARAAAGRVRLEQTVRRAVRERRFRSVLQPKIDLRTMQIVGFEALTRLVGEDGSLAPAAGFIDAATELGLLDDITEMLLDEITAGQAALLAAFGSRITTSINVSAQQAAVPRRMAELLDRLTATGRADRFAVELTENALLDAAAFQHRVLPLLRRAGVRVSIDDFGTGYASLASLLDITVEELKIDRAFVDRIHERPRSQVIVQALTAAGRELAVSVVAEGVETAEELDYLLAETSIGIAQGYLFATPMTLDELLAGRDEILARLARLAARAQGSPSVV